MRLKNVTIKNFRLLQDASLILEKKTTVIVGRNNSGKTSLTEVMRRILGSDKVTFRLEDFHFSAHKKFWNAYLAATSGAAEPDIRKLLPTIETRLVFEYELTEPIGPLSEFIIDVDPNSSEAAVIACFALKDGNVKELFAGLSGIEQDANPDVIKAARTKLFQTLRERVPSLFALTFTAVDPNDETNIKPIDGVLLHRACASGFISAQRGLDDTSHKDHAVIGKVLENLFATAKANTADPGSHDTAQGLELAVKEIQEKIGADFNSKLNSLLPALSLFGYPGLLHSELRTETVLDVGRLLSNHTKVKYTGANGIHLPEAYNGLGVRNMILMLLQLREFFKLYLAMEPHPGTHIVFIEEPEVHLHPQMQEVFIRKLREIATVFSEEANAIWPVQFVVSTHSSHLANEAHFEAIRYFLAATDQSTGSPRTVIKDLRNGLSGKQEPDRTFLHQYMTLTRCDLFFADKAILIEGTTERLILPRMIGLFDKGQPDGKKLGSQYISVVEIGGAYAHIFFDLLEFLELRTLVITDIDTVKPGTNGKNIGCPVHEGTRTSNACIKSWFNEADIAPVKLLGTKPSEKTVGKRRIAFQVPEQDAEPCGRSFEDAFMLANPTLFAFTGNTAEQRATEAWLAAKDVKKSEFALQHALGASTWTTPKYVHDGLAWLAENEAGETTPASTDGNQL